MEARLAPVAAASDVNYQAVRTEADLARLVARLERADRFAFDTETTSLDAMQAELVGLSLSPQAGEAYYIPVGHRQTEAAAALPGLPPREGNQLDWETVREALRPAFYNPQITKIAHNANFDLLIVHRAGLDLHDFRS